jgi:hypothetical protein
MTVLKILYVIALAITLVVMVGYGIHAFYEGSGGDYHRNVLIIAYVWGLLFIVVSLALKPKLGVIKTGFLVGALITIVYAACQGAGRVSDAVMFGYTAVSLFVLFSVGYIKLIDRKKPATPTLIDEFLPFIDIAYIMTTTIFLILLITFGIHAFYQGHGGEYHRNVLIIAYARGLL